MRAMVLDSPKQPLQLRDVPKPTAGRGQLLVRVSTCAVCRTDLHVVDGELPNPKLPLILGHQIVGRVEEVGSEMWEGPQRPDSRGTKAAPKFQIGDRVGIPWLGWTDGDCAYCLSGRENLCDNARFTGYTIDGGYAEFTVADSRYCFHLPERYDDVEVAPLLCAGLIGYRSYRKTGDARRLGIYGFGNAAHLISQIALYQGRELFVFTRPGDAKTQQAAKALGAKWVGGSDEMPPEKIDAAIIFASVGPLVPAGAARARQRRHRGVRRNSHDRHSVISLRRSLGRTRHHLSGQPDPKRRRRIFRNRATHSSATAHRNIPVGRSQHCAGSISRRQIERHRRSGCESIGRVFPRLAMGLQL